VTKCAIFDDSVTHKKRDFMNPMQDSSNTTRETENSAKRGKVGMSDIMFSPLHFSNVDDY